jgi:hypothetical protein
MSEPLAYFITFSTYGTWLHGRSPGSVDREHNAYGTAFIPADPELEQEQRRAMRQEPYLLDEPRREVVLRTILEVARHRKWRLWAVHVRTNHVHILVSAPSAPGKVMSDFKAWCSRRLRENFGENADRDRWTQHGSTKYIFNEGGLDEKIAYVVNGQGVPMAFFDGREMKEPEA